MGLFAALGINGIQHDDIRDASIKCRYAECRDYFYVMLRVTLQNVITLNVVAPKRMHACSGHSSLLHTDFSIHIVRARVR